MSNEFRGMDSQAIPASRLHEPGHTWRVWNVVVPAGVTAEDCVTKPEIWRLMCGQWHPMDHVHVTDDDSSFYAEYLVQDVLPGIRAILKGIGGMRLEHVGSAGRMPRNGTGACAVNRGLHRKWCVETPDGKALKEGFETEGQALTWLAQYNRMQEAAA